MSARRRSIRARWWDTATAGFWLGWKIESNWTDPLLFAAYAIARPLAGMLILVFMFIAVTHQSVGPVLGFLVVGTAFWPWVLGGVRGTVMGIIDDRERYQTARALFTSPLSPRAYLVGRALAQIVSLGVFSAIITLTVGGLALGVRYELRLAALPGLAIAILLGTVSVLALSILTTAGAISMSGEAWNLPEGVATGLYLLSGAIYPLTVLPGWLEKIAAVLPLSWWMEALRRALLPASAPRSFPWASDARVLGTLAGLTLIFVSVSAAIYGLALHRGRSLGTLDERSGY